MKKLAIITTHPIQYNAPLFRLLFERGNISIKVFYTWGEGVTKSKYDPGFGKVVEWDIPLLDGYDYEFVQNTSSNPGSHHFNGIKNPILINAINNWNPNALLVYGWSYQSHLSCLRYFKNKIPLFFRGDSTLLDSPSLLKSIIKNILLKWVYRNIDYALYVGENNRQYFEQYGIKENQLIHAPHVVDNVRFFDTEGKYSQQAAQWRNDLAIHKDDIVFLFAGKLEHKKNPELLINAFKQLSETRKNCHLIVVGDGILKNKLTELSNPSLNNSATQRLNIIFLPFQNQSMMPIVYRLADVFVLPSQGPGETWGLAVNEAMACGKAIIVSDKVGCAPDLIEQGKNGFVFKSGVENDLFNKMQEFCNNPSLVKKMGEASLNKIALFSQTYLAEIIEKSVLSMNISLSKFD